MNTSTRLQPSIQSEFAINITNAREWIVFDIFIFDGIPSSYGYHRLH